MNEIRRIRPKQGNSGEIVREAVADDKKKKAFGSRRVNCVPGEQPSLCKAGANRTGTVAAPEETVVVLLRWLTVQSGSSR